MVEVGIHVIEIKTIWGEIWSVCKVTTVMEKLV